MENICIRRIIAVPVDGQKRFPNLQESWTMDLCRNWHSLYHRHIFLPLASQRHLWAGQGLGSVRKQNSLAAHTSVGDQPWIWMDPFNDALLSMPLGKPSGIKKIPRMVVWSDSSFEILHSHKAGHIQEGRLLGTWWSGQSNYLHFQWIIQPY